MSSVFWIKKWGVNSKKSKSLKNTYGGVCEDAKIYPKKGSTKKWVCTIDEGHNRMMIDFGDEKIVFDFENKVSEGLSKVDFPIEGELFENEKKSEFKALQNMIWSARTSFSEMKITDDYGLAEDFIESKHIKIKLRELTEEETTRVQRICRYQSHVYRSDIINHRSFGVTDAQCLKFYNERFIPVFEGEEDTYNKCILAYRYFLSIYDYCGFKFTGKKVM